MALRLLPLMTHISNFAPVVVVAADVAQFFISLESFVPMLCFVEYRHNNAIKTPPLYPRTSLSNKKWKNLNTGHEIF